MNRKIHAFALLALAAAVGVVIAGCGSSSGGSTSESGSGGASSEKASSEGKSAGSASAGGAESGGAVVSLGSVKKLGMVLVDSKGMTLYDFDKDKGGKSACVSNACEEAWPPMITEGEPQVGNGASASKLGTIEREDGSMQVTYAGHPLYTFVEDTKPGEANGNDVSAFGASWYALKGSGGEAGG